MLFRLFFILSLATPTLTSVVFAAVSSDVAYQRVRMSDQRVFVNLDALGALHIESRKNVAFSAAFFLASFPDKFKTDGPRMASTKLFDDFAGRLRMLHEHLRDRSDFSHYIDGLGNAATRFEEMLEERADYQDTLLYLVFGKNLFEEIAAMQYVMECGPSAVDFFLKPLRDHARKPDPNLRDIPLGFPLDFDLSRVGKEMPKGFGGGGPHGSQDHVRDAVQKNHGNIVILLPGNGRDPETLDPSVAIGGHFGMHELIRRFVKSGLPLDVMFAPEYRHETLVFFDATLPNSYYIETIRSFIDYAMEYSGATEATIVGYSLGANLAFAYAAGLVPLPKPMRQTVLGDYDHVPYVSDPTLSRWTKIHAMVLLGGSFAGMNDVPGTPFEFRGEFMPDSQYTRWVESAAKGMPKATKVMAGVMPYDAVDMMKPYSGYIPSEKAHNISFIRDWTKTPIDAHRDLVTRPDVLDEVVEFVSDY